MLMFRSSVEPDEDAAARAQVAPSLHRSAQSHVARSQVAPPYRAARSHVAPSPSRVAAAASAVADSTVSAFRTPVVRSRGASGNTVLSFKSTHSHNSA